MPQAAAASTLAAAPLMLTRTTSTGSAISRLVPAVTAARLRTQFASLWRNATFRPSASEMSPMTCSNLPGRLANVLSAWSETGKRSKPMTRSPRVSSASVTAKPIKPAAPVTKAAIRSDRFAKQRAPTTDTGRIDPGDDQAFPDHGCDRVVYRNADFLLEFINQPRRVQIGADHGDGLRCFPCNHPRHVDDLLPGDLRERKVVLKSEMALAPTGDPQRAVVRQNAVLHIVEIGRHEAKLLDLGGSKHLVQRQHRCCRGNSGCRRDPLAQLDVGFETEPARRRTVPADDVHLRMRQQFGRAQDFTVVKLRQRARGQRDLGDLEARKMHTDLRQVRDHRLGDRLKNGVGRRRQHAEENTFGHDHSIEAGPALTRSGLSKLRMWRLMSLNRGLVMSRGRGRSIGISSRIRPGRAVMTATWVPSVRASSMLWVTKTMVPACSCQMPTSSFCMSMRFCSSSAPNGSSIKMTWGFMSNARAIPTR